MTTKKRTYTACCPSNARRQSRGGGTCIATPTDETSHLTTDEKERALVALRGLVARPFLPRGGDGVAYRELAQSEIDKIKALLGIVPGKRPPKKSVRLFAEIAKEVGVSESTVSKYAMGFGVQPPKERGRPAGIRTKFSPNREPAYRLFADGKKPADVARELGIKRQQVYLFHREWIELKASQSPTGKSE